MNEQGAGPLLQWLYRQLTDAIGAIGVTDMPGVLLACYAVYGLALAAITIPFRRGSRRVGDRLTASWGGVRRIVRDRRRRPRDAAALIGRLWRGVGLRRRSLLWPLGHVVLLLGGAWAALSPWTAGRAFRRAVGQVRPELFERRIASPFEWGADWIVSGVAAASLVAFVSALSGAVKAHVQRPSLARGGLRAATWWVLPLVAVAVGWLVTVPLASVVRPLPWTAAILALTLVPALMLERAAARRPAKTVQLPEWLWWPQLPTAVAQRPRPAIRPVATATVTPATPTAIYPAAAVPAANADSASPRRAKGAWLQRLVQAGRLRATMPPASHAQLSDATTVMPAAAATAVLPAASLADTAVSGVVATGKTAVISATAPLVTEERPAGWAGLAASITPLGAHEPKAVGGWPLTGRIGSGGMAIVYLAQRGAESVAIKVANPMVSTEVRAPERLLREIMALSRVGGSGVVTIKDVGIDSAHPYIVMEYLQGPTLATAVAQRGGIRDRAQLRALGGHLAGALRNIHRAGVAHRDLKPANVMLTDGGAVVVDLGIARLTDAAAGLTQTGAAIGSVGYLAPEVLLATPNLDAKTADVWSWGALMAYAATGRPLFGEARDGSAMAVMRAVCDERRDPAAMDGLAALDTDLARLVWDCTRADPTHRPRDGATLAAAVPTVGSRWGAPW